MAAKPNPFSKAKPVATPTMKAAKAAAKKPAAKKPAARKR